MDRRFQDGPHLRAVASGAQAPQFADGPAEQDGPSFLPPMRRRSRRDRKPSRPEPHMAAAAPMPVQPPPAAPQRKAEAVRPPPVARKATAAPSGWMTDAEQLAAATAAPEEPDWANGFNRPAKRGRAAHPAHAGQPLRPAAPGHWLRPAFPWLAPRSLVLLTGLLLLGGLAAGVASLRGGNAAPVSSAAPVAQHQLRQLLGQLEECRGIESLLVMLPNGVERESTLARLQRQQHQIDTWLRDNGAWLAASHGAQALAELRDASAAWRSLQQRVVQAEVVQGRTGLANESRQLLTGPSAAAYRRVVQLVDRMRMRQAS